MRLYSLFAINVNRQVGMLYFYYPLHMYIMEKN
jgi:hypothetical protein